MIKRGIIFLALIYVFIAFQCTSDYPFVSYIENGIQLETGEINLKVQFYADNIVHVVKWGSGGSPDKQSLVVIKNSLPYIQLEIDEKSRYINISGDKIALRILKEDGIIEYSGLNSGTVLIESDKPVFTPFNNEYEEAFSVEQKFRLTPYEGIYGLGQHQYGYMNYRGRTVKLVQTNTDAVNPFLISFMHEFA